MKLVVVGGVAAGLSAASEARRTDKSAEITVLEKGARISYGTCGMPYFIEGQVREFDDLTVYTPEFFEQQRNIRIRTGCEVTAVQHARREVLLKSGERVRYDRLVWAAGARPAIAAQGERMFTFHNDSDAVRLHHFLEERKPRTAAVIGGGYIGLEMVTALRARGLKVVLYHATLSLLNRQEDWLTKKLLARLEQCGVEVHLNQRMQTFDALPQDLVLLATGLKPNVEIMEAAGAELGRSGALRVNDRQETSLSGVYAAGDCAEVQHTVSGRPVWMPLAPAANKAGHVAGANAAGGRLRFPGVAGTSMVRVCGMAVAMTGLGTQQARREGLAPVDVVVESRDRPKYFHGRMVEVQLVADRGSRRLIGATLAGDAGVSGRINVVAAALAARMKVEEFAAVDMAYTPPYSASNDPLLVAARKLVQLLD